MAGIWKNNPDTPEGKYPIVLRRDGTVLTKPYFVLVMGDPGFGAALSAYAKAHEFIGSDPAFVADVRALVKQELEFAATLKDLPLDDPMRPDPDAPRHRKDDPVLIAWARSVTRHGQGGA